MKTVPCDNIICIARIDAKEYRDAQERIKEKSGSYGMVMCDTCTPAPEGHWLYELNEMGMDDMLRLLSEQD